MSDIYTVRIDGVEYDLQGDHEPTEAEARAAIGQHEAAVPPQAKPRTWTDTAVDAIPTLAGAAGGIIGGIGGTVAGFGVGGVPGAVGGAAVGGAGGEAARQLVNRLRGVAAPASSLDAAKGIGTQAALQGGSELVGQGVGKAIGAAAPRLLQSVLKPSKAIRAEFPTVVRDTLDTAVPVGRSGVEKADRLVGEAAGRTRAVLQKAEAAGAKPVTMRPVLSSLHRVSDKVSDQPLRQVDLATLRTIRDQALAENPTPISLTAAQDMKQAAQRIAQKGYRQIDRGADINSVPLDANMAIASGLREAIERRVPEVAGLNQQTQRLMGVSRAAEDAAGRIENNQPFGMNDALSVIVGGGADVASGSHGLGLTTGLAMKALTTPAIASRLAIGMHKGAPAVRAVTPQLLRAALLKLMASHQQPEQ